MSDMHGMPRRDFLKTMAATGAVAGIAARQAAAQPAGDSLYKIRAFDFDGVALRDSRWKQQYDNAREYYFNVSDDDILHGFRAAAGLPAPGKPLGGWAERDSSVIFGQWLSGMSRIYRNNADTEMRDKAAYLMREFAKTVAPDGNCRMEHYPYEKLVCGLVDMHVYANQQEAIPLLERVTDYASKNFDRTRKPASPVPWENHSGKPLEWYTLSENLFRAYVASGNSKFKEFAEVWQYHPYWNKFADTASPVGATSVHAYSHVNSFNGAAMSYAVERDPKYLNVIRNAYDYLQNTQCYATGGYGPVERIMPRGSLGRALEYQPNSCEASCDTWAGFKLVKSLTQFTGEARYGDWAERMLYNTIGAALQIHGEGQHFYYADYRVNAGVKIYTRHKYTCCSGTYIQNIADYPDQIYYHDDRALYVSLFVPSEVTWRRPEGNVKVVQETKYPESETITLTVQPTGSAAFPLNFRVPGWARDVSLKINGAPANVKCTPGQWATLDRTWNSGDRVEITIPLRLRLVPVDEEHPRRVAIVRGPVVLVSDANVHEPIYQLPATEADLNKYFVPDGEQPGSFKYVPPDGTNVMARYSPFYSIIAFSFYRMHFDLDDLPVILWS